MYLPVMREFWDKVLYYREHIDELPVPKPKEKRPRKKKEEKPVACEIVEMSEDEYLSD
jgi:hypothetical protein